MKQIFLQAAFYVPLMCFGGLNLHTATEIADVCEVSAESAQIRAERMKELYKREKFLTSPLERQVFEQFKGFIEENRP